MHVSASGDTLVVRGPRRLETVARDLITQKSRVMRALADEEQVSWRVKAMGAQATHKGMLPLLFARPGALLAPGRCFSCGGPVGLVDRYRCRPCIAATVRVLGAVPTAGARA